MSNPKVVAFNPHIAPSFMQQVWIRGKTENEFYKTHMKAIPRRGDIIFVPDEKKHFSILSIQWFEAEANDWVCVINIDRNPKKRETRNENV